MHYWFAPSNTHRVARFIYVWNGFLQNRLKLQWFSFVTIEFQDGIEPIAILNWFSITLNFSQQFYASLNFHKHAKIVFSSQIATVAIQPLSPNCDLNFSAKVSAAFRFSAMANVVEPLPDMSDTSAPFSRRNSL